MVFKNFWRVNVIRLNRFLYMKSTLNLLYFLLFSSQHSSNGIGELGFSYLRWDPWGNSATIRVQRGLQRFGKKLWKSWERRRSRETSKERYHTLEKDAESWYYWSDNPWSNHWHRCKDSWKIIIEIFIIHLLRRYIRIDSKKIIHFIGYSYLAYIHIE